jgi:hypothetical protein
MGYVAAMDKGIAYIDHADYFARFLEFFLSEENFSKLARLPAPRGLLGLILNHPDVPFQLIASREGAFQLKDELQRNWMNGLDALYVLRQPLSAVLAFSLTAQYTVGSRTTVGSKEDGDPREQFSDQYAFERFLVDVKVKRGECVVLFAHDGDPLYLMEPGE